MKPAVSTRQEPAAIALLGTPVTSRNQGVQALGASLVNLCVRAAGTKDVRILTSSARPSSVVYRAGGKNLDVPVVNYRLSPKSAPCEHLAWIVMMSLCYRIVPLGFVRRTIAAKTPWIAALESCGFAGDIRGGDSFSDIYGMKRYTIGFLLAWSVLLVKGTMVQFPQTYGPFKGSLARAMARFLLKRSSLVIARDKASREVARGLLGPSREVLLSPDVAFSLEVVRPEHPELDPVLTGAVPSGIIGLNVNGLMYHGGYTRSNMFGLKMDYPAFLGKLVVALLEAQENEVWLVPHTYAENGDVESDPDASYKLRDSLPAELRGRVRIVSKEYDQHSIKGVIGMCDFFIGSRMHSCIAALSQGIPCVGVAYSMKFRGVFESVGMEDWVVDGRATGDDEAVSLITGLYQKREDVRVSLGRNADAAREQLAVVFGRMMDNFGLSKPVHSPAVGLEAAVVE
jgi:colanic acid/amylovoran biosynthesis protein